MIKGMKKKISLGMWLSVFFGGIRQLICNIFSWKNKTPFWRVIWATITACILAITCMLCYDFCRGFQRRNEHKFYLEGRYDSNLSPDFKYCNNGYNKGKSYIYNSRTKKKVIKGIDWIAVPKDGDSLIIVAKDGKRGFVNRYTAEIAIPFKYDAAWSFTDGVAGVCEGDSVYFIDHTGNPIHGRKFARRRGYNRYVYHGSYAAIPLNGKFGLLDRNGNWVLQPQHDDIYIGARNMWYVRDNDKCGVIGTNGQIAIPVEYENALIHPDNGITVVKADHSKSRYDYDGTLLDEFVFDDVYNLAYFTNEFDEGIDQKQPVDDNMLKYSAGNYYGLMTKNGVPVTAPLYINIEVVTPGVYKCQIPETSECIMINAKGIKIND